MKRIVTNILLATCMTCWVTGIAGAAPKIFSADDGGSVQGERYSIHPVVISPPSPNPPAISIVGPAIESSYPFGTVVNFSASFSDDGGTHAAVWTFEGQSVAGTVDESTGSVTGSWNFSTPGYHFVTLTITDQGGNSVSVTTIVVVFDRGDGFLNGRGRFDSPAGALVSNPQAAGRVDFDFDTRYRRDDLVPTGTTSFKFTAGNMDFASSNCDWFMVGFARGMYRGTGTINGAGSFRFLISGMDGDDLSPVVVDRIRLKITDMNGVVVYDNQMGAPDTAMATTPITSGGIEARLPNGGLGHLNALQPRVEPAALAPARGFNLAQNSPNPFRASTELRFSLPQRSEVKIAVFDVAGRQVASLADGAWNAGTHSVSWAGTAASGQAARGGVYFVRLAARPLDGAAPSVAVRKVILQD